MIFNVPTQFYQESSKKGVIKMIWITPFQQNSLAILVDLLNLYKGNSLAHICIVVINVMVSIFLYY